MDISRTRLLLSACLTGLSAFQLPAATVALWPLEYGPKGSPDAGRCAISADNDLSAGTMADAYDATGSDGVGWNLPPNPDATPNKRFDPVNRTAAKTTAAVQAVYTNPTLATRKMAPTMDYTLEGWVRFDALPANGSWYCLSSLSHDDGAYKTLFSFRNNSGGYTKTTHPDETEWYSFQIVSGSMTRSGAQAGEIPLWAPKGAEVTALVGAWHHFALTHEAQNATSGKREYTLYIDGVKKGDTCQCDVSTMTGSTTDQRLTLNGRPGQVSSIAGALDYCRLCDTVLAPADFLCAGGTGTVIPPPSPDPTAFYWPLNRNSDGSINGFPAAGDAYLGGGVLSGGSNLGPTVADPLDMAFGGNVPNTATTVRSLKANAGSFFNPYSRDTTCKAIYSTTLGQYLTHADDFTVEGWFKYEQPDTGFYTCWLQVCGTLTGNTGWGLELYVNTSKESADQYFTVTSKANGTQMRKSQVPFKKGFPFGTWMHLALVHDADGGDSGFGSWTLYVNGESCGVQEDNEIPSGLTYNGTFSLFGTASSSCACVPGKLDHWRVCRAALAPNQFLCASTGAADATNVLAYWPLDAQEGAYLDGTDLTGNHTLEATRDAKHVAKATDDTPPQADLAAGSGSVAFSGLGGTQSYLFSKAPNLLGFFNQDSWTVEMWMKRANDTSATWQILFQDASGEPMLSTSPSSIAFFTYRPANATVGGRSQSQGFVLWANVLASGIADSPFVDGEGNTVTVPANVWTHVAMTYEKTGGQGVFKLYVDGIYRAQLSGAAGTPAATKSVLVGGRPASANSFQGQLAGVRLSNGVLAPSSFLCNRAPSSATRAMWPLEASGNALEANNRIDLFGAFGSDNASATDDRARKRVPNPDMSPGYAGNRKRNVGSVQLASQGVLVTSLDGSQDDATAALTNGGFTVEGWYKWSDTASGTRETLCGDWTVGTASTQGWRLMIDTSVSPAVFRVKAKPPYPKTSVVDKAFAVSPVKNVWQHLALTYAPLEGRGTWKLYRDGVLAGSVENDLPSVTTLGSGAFRLGADAAETDATSFVGTLDMWRYSRGVRAPADFLYANPVGTLLIFR